MKTVIGTCSNCGGKVETYKHWAGSDCPAPSCSGCGWVVKSEYGPVIPMQPKGMEMEPRIQVDVAEELNEGLFSDSTIEALKKLILPVITVSVSDRGVITIDGKSASKSESEDPTKKNSKPLEPLPEVKVDVAEELNEGLFSDSTINPEH